MDLEHLSEAASEAESGAIDALLGPARAGDLGPTPSEARARRTFLLPALLALQNRVGWISPGGLGYACRRLGVPPAEAWGVATFYALLALGERPAAFAHVCQLIDHLFNLGGVQAGDDLLRFFEIRLGETHAREM